MIRLRLAADLDGCVAALRAVHEADSYPLNWPSDPRLWLTPAGLSRAWVAEGPGGVIDGHVAVRQPGELCRLFVAPAARRRSVGRALVSAATAWATERHVGLTLDVADEQRSAAVAFYEATGWRHTHTTQAEWTAPDGSPVDLRHYGR
ncbi:GNAT family N-acetyltransferase [Asanoa sp. NPDC049573]|uniref:GNAT family N-acetyltransferase n=1 Tax=Asanoa sp. NPDC049573 TaxID=3155396 RepID=UPI00341DF7FB